MSGAGEQAGASVADEVDRLIAGHHLRAATRLARITLAAGGLAAREESRLRLTLSTVLFLGHQPGAVEEADAVLRLADHEQLPAGIVAEAQLARLLALLAEDRTEDARQQANAILAGRDQLETDAALAGALFAFAILAWNDGRAADAVDFLDAAIRRADAGPVEARQLHPRLGLAPVLIAMGELTAASRCLREVRVEIADVGNVLWATAPAMFEAAIALVGGHLDEARVTAEEAIAQAEETGARLLLALGRTTCATIALFCGNIDEAERQLRRGQSDGSPAIGYGSAQLIWLEARIAGARGGSEAAAQVGAGLLTHPEGHRRLLVEEPAAAAWFTRVALAVGDRGAARRVVSCVERLAADSPTVPMVAMAAEHARALLDADVDLLDRVAKEHRRPWARGSAAEDAGVLSPAFAAGGARRRFDDAVEAYTEAGASRDVARIQRRIRRLDQAPTGQDRPLQGWASLTDAELRVARLVGAGLTNIETSRDLYLSRHTVDFHLRHVYRKLQIRSRVDLARIVSEQALGAVD